MSPAADITAVFLRMLEFCATEVLIAESDLRAIEQASHPCNPLDLGSESDRPEFRFAMRQAFSKVLTADLDWERVRLHAAALTARLHERQQQRDEAGMATRWLPLEPGNGFFDAVRWSACWSRRDLEGVLGFFTEDALYIDLVRNLHAQGKSDLRRLLSRLFHASDATAIFTAANFVPGEREIELEWAQKGTRIPGPDISASLGGGTVRGTSNLRVEETKVSVCIDRPNAQDMERIGRHSLGFEKAPGGGEIRQAKSYVLLDRIVVFKPLKLKKAPPKQE